MQINNPTFNGGKHQFANKIINNNQRNFSLKFDSFWPLVPKEHFSPLALEKLSGFLDTLGQDNLSALDMQDTVNHIVNLMGHQAGDAVPQAAYEFFFKNDQGEAIKYDAFLSFANEDGDAATALYEALTAQGLKVWFSRVHLEHGSSIWGVIDEAIRNSESGIVLLSEHTFSDPTHFPIQELNTLRNLEIYRNRKLIPVYHGIDNGFILDNYATLSDLYATNTRKGILTAAEDVGNILQKIKQERTL